MSYVHDTADLRGSSHLRASTQARYAPTVTSVRSSQKDFTAASCGGRLVLARRLWGSAGPHREAASGDEHHAVLQRDGLARRDGLLRFGRCARRGGLVLGIVRRLRLRARTEQVRARRTIATTSSDAIILEAHHETRPAAPVFSG